MTDRVPVPHPAGGCACCDDARARVRRIRAGTRERERQLERQLRDVTRALAAIITGDNQEESTR